MDNIKKFIDDLGIAAFETNIKIAGVAVLSDSGSLIYQTENWDVSNQTKLIINVVKGEKSIIFNEVNFLVVKTTDTGIIATNEKGMGHIIFAPFQGGLLISYAMPQADPFKALTFLSDYALRLNGKV